MKAIISHDIDHLTVWEHFGKDLILPKFIIRSNIELLKGKIGFPEFFNRISDFFRNKWQNIDELIEFNQSKKIPSSFFIGVQNGLGLSYPAAASAWWIKHMREKGCEVGVHGIEFENLESITKEYNLFKSLSDQASVGTRMHYVRKNEFTLLNMSKTGYLYDSTEHAFKNPYKIGNMWEFPFQIMDGWVIEKGRRWQTQNLEEAKENTKQLIEQAHQEGIKYLGIDFHDRYFSQSFKTWINWYTWLAEYLEQNNISFINFTGAVKELEDQ